MKKRTTYIGKITGCGLSMLLLTGMVACDSNTEVADTEVATSEAPIAEELSEDVGRDNIDLNQFNSDFASTNYYEEWDENDDNLLDENEYRGGMYSTWDVNNDNQLDENEFTTASNDWGLENESWADWDTSGDGILDENEFNTGFADNGWFDDWDADNDNMLAEREYSEGVFGVWDENDDNLLGSDEYGYYNTYYGA
ncbi:hypothetical protein [Pontibacter actiniarum]|uniref:EF-hand domain-containing protein n=1 Tax=Pontibacter actiniarum TaxID=323450 RepID=A0A1X9YRC8_9BACT|nr:hypothetical protein [Pontibacter actiniarum]ARS35427.1 hypothetical protein CA264_08235 [Pontibacter actiniarum]